VHTVKLPGGEEVPILGLGTWMMGEVESQFELEVAAICYAMGRGIRLIDTAEMYANGGAEKVVGTAIKRSSSVKREDIFIISKVLPSNAHFQGVIQSCDHSIDRLGVSFIDLYLLHWPGVVPLQETLDAFEVLRSSGKIRYFGVSNFDVRDMLKWLKCKGGGALAANQILYNLSRRGVEWDVIPFCNDYSFPVIAYSPLEQGRLHGSPVLSQLAEKYGTTSLQVALAWVLSQKNVITIPKAVNLQHIDQNIDALEITLDAEDNRLLDLSFPPPSGPSPLEML